MMALKVANDLNLIDIGKVALLATKDYNGRIKVGQRVGFFHSLD